MQIIKVDAYTIILSTKGWDLLKHAYHTRGWDLFPGNNKLYNIFHQGGMASTRGKIDVKFGDVRFFSNFDSGKKLRYH